MGEPKDRYETEYDDPPMQGDEIARHEALEEQAEDIADEAVQHGSRYADVASKIYKALTAAEARGYERGIAEMNKHYALGEREGFLRCREEAAKMIERDLPQAENIVPTVVASAIRSLKP